MPAGKYIRTPEIRNRMSLSHLGHRVSEETKEKIRQYNIDTKAHLRFGSGPAWNKGVVGKFKHSEETKLQISKTNKESGHRPPIMRGEDHYNWQGGITSEHAMTRNSPEYAQWRESVFKRDKWTCQKYGTLGSNCILRAHHIMSFHDNPELRLVIENGITLSDRAHDEFHNRYGRGNNTLAQLKEFLCNQVFELAA